MRIKHYYTEKQLRELLSHLVILMDSREQNNKHITDVWDKNNVKYKQKALKTGDYSFYMEACPELGFIRDTYFTDELCIEKKFGVDEIASNLVEKDERFMRELTRMQSIETVYIIIEDDSLNDIMNHNYRSKYNELSFLRTLLTTQKRSNFYLYFCPKNKMAEFIYEICRNILTDKILK